MPEWMKKAADWAKPVARDTVIGCVSGSFGGALGCGGGALIGLGSGLARKAIQ